jgi:hypothetical protein
MERNDRGQPHGTKPPTHAGILHEVHIIQLLDFIALIILGEGNLRSTSFCNFKHFLPIYTC